MDQLSAIEIVKAIQANSLAADDSLIHVQKVIENCESEIRAFCHQSETFVAPEVNASGTLAGVPVAVKDCVCTADMPTTACSRILQTFLPPDDATVVKRLRDAGAIIVGKTNMDEFAMGGSNENSAFGPCRNPWDTSRVSGGSSGGAAAAVAARMAPL